MAQFLLTLTDDENGDLIVHTTTVDAAIPDEGPPPSNAIALGVQIIAFLQGRGVDVSENLVMLETSPKSG